MSNNEVYFLLGIVAAIIMSTVINMVYDFQLKKDRKRAAQIQAAFCKRIDKEKAEKRELERQLKKRG